MGYFRDQLQSIASQLAASEEEEEEGDDVASIEQLVLILCGAHEFSELPVRHNEEHLNLDLAKLLPWQGGLQMDMESSHTKAFLLLLAHFHRTALPISDYVTDTKSVLDQAPRVLNALIDMSAGRGLLEVTLRLLRVSQMLVQALPADASQLLQLPHMSPGRLQALALPPSRSSKNSGKHQGQSIHHTASPSSPIATIKDLFALDTPSVEARMRDVFRRGAGGGGAGGAGGSKEFRDFMGVLAGLPRLSLAVDRVQQQQGQAAAAAAAAAGGGGVLERAAGNGSGGVVFSLPPSPSPSSLDLQVQFSITSKRAAGGDLGQYRQQQQQRGGGRGNTVYCPKYHKSKKLSWFVVLGCASSGELCALQKLGPSSSSSSSSSAGGQDQVLLSSSLSWTVHRGGEQQLREEEEEEEYILFLVPDAVFGIEVLGRFSLTAAAVATTRESNL